MTIEYINENNYDFPFDEEKLIAKLLEATVSEVGCPYEAGVCVSLVGEDEIYGLNKEYRDIDSPTDVLSFPLNEYEEPAGFSGEVFKANSSFDPESGEMQLGDVVLCYERIISQAEEYGHSVMREFAFLVVHSLLHLFGYDHISDEEREQMESVQRDILDKLSITRQ